MKNGYKIWDTDTHIQPTVEVVEPYYDPGFRKRLPELERYKPPVPADNGTQSTRYSEGRHRYAVGKVAYRRILGQAEPPVEPVANYGKFQGSKLPSLGVADDQVNARIRDMDEEGVDVQLMVPGVTLGVVQLKDAELEMG